ncbi:1-deoxy-D-xylulose-5-phosphate synthase [Clostridium rectalis]|uniref:1-deoxy-D-xylulose-5-phosphate synthase n=1 Tax=Clostridium rectalis TaxID=2040295 RepID=UPI000F639F83|nr:1-deoxy-D-xylulose-5-phosphate synthase [Clostridium rectalis]
MYKILDEYKDINEIRSMTLEELDVFAKEIREFLIENVSKTGGHLASNLGVVELTISLYNVFNFKEDRLIWDVGHQSYVHKILTGRKDKFDTLRKYNGLSGFPKKVESKYDHFETGHSSTSISAALGMARARDLKKQHHEVVAVIGDGALTGGMALEALNDIGYRNSKMIIILNDNQMSIGKNVGGLSTYLSKLRVEPGYNKFKQDVESVLKKIPNIGGSMARTIEKIKNGIKQMVVPGMLFENMGIKYFGPIDGHNIKELSKVMSKAREIKGPVLIHVVTTKGKGYEFAENNPDKFHGIGPFDCTNGKALKGKVLTYSQAFGDSMIKVADENEKVVAITAAMRDGTGLEGFAKKFKNRFFDVGIAEQHAVTMAAGMAADGLRPVFAVYSTFLQRAYDQVLHDVCIQNLPVVFAIDRAGIVGADGETHQGIFDLSYLSHIPNMTIMAPKCVYEIEHMLRWALNQDFPVAIRYPRGGDCDKSDIPVQKDFKIGKWEVLYDEGNIAVIATGKMVSTALLARERLLNMGVKISVINAPFIKPLDIAMLKNLTKDKENIITLEDNVLYGGFGSLVLDYLHDIGKSCKVINLAFKDEFVPHGNVNILYKNYGLDVDGIVENIIKLI